MGTYQGSPIYIRHLTHREHLDYDRLKVAFEEDAKAKGAKTEEERLASLKAQGLWSDDKDSQIERQKLFITQLEDGRKVISLPSVMQSQENQIKTEKAKLVTMENERVQLIGTTSESHAQHILDDHYIIHNLFRDQSMTSPVFTDDTFEDLVDMSPIYTAYGKATEPCLDPQLRKMAVQAFFTDYFNLCGDSISDFFGRPICDMTYYQVRLGNIARYFKTLMSNTDFSKVAPEVRGDPDAIERLHITQRNQEAGKAEGNSPVGMTQEDLKQSGMTSQMTQLPKTNLGGMDLIKHLQNQQKARGG